MVFRRSRIIEVLPRPYLAQCNPLPLFRLSGSSLLSPALHKTMMGLIYGLRMREVRFFVQPMDTGSFPLSKTERSCEDRNLRPSPSANENLLFPPPIPFPISRIPGCFSLFSPSSPPQERKLEKSLFFFLLPNSVIDESSHFCSPIFFPFHFSRLALVPMPKRFFFSYYSR